MGSLPDHVQDLVGRSTRTIEVERGHSLREPHRRLRSVSFIRKGLVSVLGFDVLGGRAGVALVGREGVIGISLAFGGSSVAWGAEAVTACTVDEIESEEFLSLCEAHPAFLRAMVKQQRERMALMMAFSALAAKVRLKERLSAWLLVATDRLGHNDIEITHSELSRLLGVRRASVTEALHVLEGEGVVISMRGKLIVRDRRKLENVSPFIDCGAWRPTGTSSQ